MKKINRIRVNTSSHVAILISIHNGSQFLSEQIDSIASQSHSNWSLHILNDNSTDSSKRIIDHYAKQISNRVSTWNALNNNFCKSFLQLVCNKKIQADYFAYADQDDIWDKDKLKVALEYLTKISADLPALYCSRTTIVDKENQRLSLSPSFKRSPSFANALVQSIGGGNTMVFNLTAKKLLEKAGSKIKVPSHDWWTYLVVTGCGGKVFYDAEPYIRYRQHEHNLVGHNESFVARYSRLKMLLQGVFKTWGDQNIVALQTIEAQLTPDNQKNFNKFASARKKYLLPRLIGIRQSGVYRQTVFGNIGLFVATVINKI